MDFALWVDGLGRFAIQVKGGEYMLDHAGAWCLRTPDGSPVKRSSPVDETADGCMEMRAAIHKATGYTHFMPGVLIFPDMRRDEDIERAAQRETHVYTVWGVDRLRDELERIAGLAGIVHPPEPGHSENEARRVNALQYRDVGAGPGADRGGRNHAGGAAAPEETEQQFTVASATFNIQRVDKLVVQHFHLERGADGRPLLPQP